MSWPDYIRALRRSWWIVLLTTVVATVSAVYVSQGGESTYQTDARLVVGPSATLEDPEAVLGTTVEIKAQLVTTYADLLTGSQFFEEAIDEIGLSPEDAQKYTVASAAPQESNVVRMSVEGPDPSTTVALADAVAQSSSEYFETVYRGFGVEVFDEPQEPSTPSGPPTSTNVAIGFVLGLAAGVGLALAREAVAPPRERGRPATALGAETARSRRPERVRSDGATTAPDTGGSRNKRPSRRATGAP